MARLNPFDTLEDVRQDHLTYVRTFQRFRNSHIKNWVMDRIEHGTLLWKLPFVPLLRPSAPVDQLESMVEEGMIHAGIRLIFRPGPEFHDSRPVRTYKHQPEALQRTLAEDSWRNMTMEDVEELVRRLDRLFAHIP